ncbi:MAG: LysR family transcriptional regulator [Oscillospiraceae bacterium]|nr:LysR family transcriptional regulator [Oscillospiraceae bacterium]
MDTFKIKAILAAVQHQSLSRAAEEFSYTPSAFSHMTAAFEKELGVQLFHRHSKGVELTEAGKALYPKLQAMLQSEKDLLDTAAELAGHAGPTLRIATHSSISRNFLSDILKEFKKQHPEIRIAVTVSDNLGGWLQEDRADILFADTTAFRDNEWTAIMEDRFLAVTPQNMVGARTVISREELYDYPQIFTDDLPLREYFDVSRFKELTYFRSEDDLSVVNMVRTGLGITILPALALKGNAEGTVLLELDPPLTRTLGFACKKNRKKFPALDCFVRFVANYSFAK